MFGLTPEEVKILKALNTPRKIQNFLDSLAINFEPKGDTCLSPREVLRQRRAHCIEGAMLAAVALRLHGYKPLVIDLQTVQKDFDHVVAVFKQHGHWGAISKTNHAVLRYREPVYKTIRELVMSYFHEYFMNENRKKTLRSYTNPIDLSQFDDKGWVTAEGDVWYIAEHLAEAPHIDLLSRSQISTLRLADLIEVSAGRLVEWNDPVASARSKVQK